MLAGPRAWLLFALILGCHLALTLTALDADPPLSLAGGPTPDEGLYVANARNAVVEGRAQADDWDNSLLHPIGSFLSELIFHRFGVGLVQARSLSVTLSALSLVLFFHLLYRASGPLVALLGALILATNPFFITYGRQAGPAASTIFFMLLSIYFWDLARSRRLFLIPTGITLATASLVENGPQNFFFMFTAGLALLMIRMQAWKMPWAGPTRSRRQWVTALAFFTTLAWLGLFVFPRLDRFLRLSELPLGVPRWGNVLQNLFMAPFTFWGYVRWTPDLCLIAVTYFLLFARSLFAPIARHLPLAETRVWFFAWLVTAPFFLAMQAQRPLAVMTVMTPPICMAAAEALVRFLSLRQVRKPRVDILVALGSMALGIWFVTQGVVHGSVERWYQKIPPSFFNHQFRYEFLIVLGLAAPLTVLAGHLWLRWKRFTIDLSPQFVSWVFVALLLAVLGRGVFTVTRLLVPAYTIRETSRALRAIPADAVVGGTWAPLLSLESGRRGLVIWPTLNNRDPIRRYRVTHLLLQRGSSEDLPNSRVFSTPEGGGVPPARFVQAYSIGEQRLDLYQVMTPR